VRGSAKPFAASRTARGTMADVPLERLVRLKIPRAVADSTRVDAARTVPYRRIGTILVDRQLITDDQLARALVEQKNTGRPLGEICVDRYGLDRLALADGLSEQWEEMQRAGAYPPHEDTAGEATVPVAVAATSVGHAEADELRVLLGEAEAARVELASKTDELGRRLAVLETLVVGVTDALAELRPAAPDQVEGNGENGHGRAAPRAKRARAGARTTARRAASA